MQIRRITKTYQQIVCIHAKPNLLLNIPFPVNEETNTRQNLPFHTVVRSFSCVVINYDHNLAEYTQTSFLVKGQ